MLTKLYVSNYALIDNIEITLDDGLSIITGETGAGKSILLGALSLLLGARSDIKKCRRADKKVVVEGIFQAEGYGLQAILEEQDIDWSPELILRREISPAGRSRSFINDTPVAASLLSQVAARLIDIHSQHQNLLIGNHSFQLSVLDALADNNSLKQAYTECFKEYVEQRRHINALREQIAKTRENQEFIRFRLEQLRKLKPRAGEQAELERRQEILADSASISEILTLSTAALNEGDDAVLSRLHRIRSGVQNLNPALFSTGEEDDDAPSLSIRLENVIIELTDIAETLTGYMDRVETDPALLDKVENRLSALYDAQRRFGVSDEQGLVDLLSRLETEYAGLEETETTLPELENSLKAKARELRLKADALSDSRRQAADTFAAQLMKTAAPLGMRNLKFAVTLTSGKMTSEGQDQPEFICAFNKNQQLMPVEKIASGGEISRLMLCLKAIVASRMSLPTIIFDEVDTGVSGDIAARMASLMKRIAADIQVIAITHLPQIAACGDRHFMVYKQDTDQETLTHIRLLDEDERVRETARMLAGDTIDEAAMLNASSLLARTHSDT